MKKALKLINQGLEDEKKAPKYYSKLKKELPLKDRGKISKIQKQEKEHFKTLKEIKNKLKSK